MGAGSLHTLRRKYKNRNQLNKIQDGGVAVLACNATAAACWARRGWRLNNNPASQVYRVLWAALEPALFAFTGTFFVVHFTLSWHFNVEIIDKRLNTATARTMLYGVAILCVCLTVRLCTAAVTCWNMSFREKLYVCCTWTPKSIVEAVLSPVAIHSVLMRQHSKQAAEHAEDLLRLIVQAILITTPIGFLFTHYLGPILLRTRKKHEIVQVN